MINKKRLIKLTQDLLRINSENPPGRERRIALFVASKLKKMGLKPRLRAFAPGRDNVLAVLKGSRKGGSLLLTPHLDTVPAGRGWSHEPFSGVLKGQRIYGRGATDCKGNVAVCLEVLESLKEDGFRPLHDVIFLATADEETGSGLGLKPYLEKNLLRPSFALVLDSDEFNIIVAQKGLIHFSVDVYGKKAHGAYPERGENAIEGAIRLIGVLKKISLPQGKHSLLKPLTINIGKIEGGDKVNMVPDRCCFQADLRFLPGTDGARILRLIRRSFDETGIRYKLIVDDLQRPYEIPSSHRLVTSLKRAAEDFSLKSAVKGSEGATVITFFQNKGIPAVATGYGSSGCAHATDEFVRCRDLWRGALVLERFIKLFDQAKS